nr:helix-turn-helix transcriptional regulator [uncultured Oscillibacter sp.]
MIVYDPFWRTLKGRGISTYKMINKLGYSSGTLYRLRHNKGISSRLIDDLCKLLDCRVEDILEYVPDPEEPEAPDTEPSP